MLPWLWIACASFEGDDGEERDPELVVVEADALVGERLLPVILVPPGVEAVEEVRDDVPGLAHRSGPEDDHPEDEQTET